MAARAGVKAAPHFFGKPVHQLRLVPRADKGLHGSLSQIGRSAVGLLLRPWKFVPADFPTWPSLLFPWIRRFYAMAILQCSPVSNPTT